MKVHIPSVLLSYTDAPSVEATGATVRAALADLDRRFPGICFRLVDEQGGLRPHMRIAVDGAWTRDLDQRLQPTSSLHIVQALSGG